MSTNFPKPSNPDLAIRLSGVSKTHQMNFRPGSRLGAFLYGHLQSRANERKFHAIHDLSCELPRGRLTLIVGENGAGKSTLLRALCGITPVDAGTIEIDGKISALLELGFGFHPELNGYENCYLQGAILGLSRSEIESRLPAIIEFAGIHSALDQPVRYYSAGMFARLAFSLSLHVDPDILLVDEILAVGDAEFQQKSFSRILALRDAGRTVLLVSHNLSMISNIADDALWLKQGRLEQYGPARQVLRNYQRWANDSLNGRGAETGGRFGAGAETGIRYLDRRRQWAAAARAAFRGEITGLELREADGAPMSQPRPLAPFTVRAHYAVGQPLDELRVKCLILRSDGVIVAESVTPDVTQLRDWPSAGTVDFAFESLPLIIGKYRIAAGFYHSGDGQREVRLCEREIEFAVDDLDLTDESNTFYIEGTCVRVD